MSYFIYKDKQVFYEEIGTGPTVFLLHGNTASGHMFDDIKKLYQEYHLVIPDFLGHGRSDPLDTFPIDFWYDQGLQILELMKVFPEEPIILIGSSGGAMAALNAALTDPSRITGVVADSFVGESCEVSMLRAVKEERAEHLSSEEGSMFYRWMQGDRYREVVEMDTAMLYAHAREYQQYFHKPLASIQVPTLMLGSCEDELIVDMKETFMKIAEQSTLISCFMFETGGHPAMLSNALDSATKIQEFIASFI